MALSDTDPSSFSNPTQCKTTKIDIFWNINFDKETINGSVGLTVERLDKSCQNLVYTFIIAHFRKRWPLP